MCIHVSPGDGVEREREKKKKKKITRARPYRVYCACPLRIRRRNACFSILTSGSLNQRAESSVALRLSDDVPTEFGSDP